MVAISSIKQISQDCVQLTLSAGSCFFIRLSYLQQLAPARLVPGVELSDAEFNDVADAGLAFSAEKAANSYLERSEQCRFLLAGKLRRKGFDPVATDVALDFLEAQGILSDSRYAAAWLRNRSIHHSEGRLKLLGELVSRGIDRKVAEQAVEEHFTEIDEDTMLQRAVEKCRRLGKDKGEAEAYLRRKGFPAGRVKSVVSCLSCFL